MPWSTCELCEVTAVAATAPAEAIPIARAAAMAVFLPDHVGGLTAGAVVDTGTYGAGSGVGS